MNNSTGIVFSYRSRFFRLVDIEWGRDNSFYFMPHRHDSEVRERIKTEQDETGTLILSVDEVVTDCFPTKKISRHASGYFHIKDVVGRGGRRAQDGLVGQAFSELDGFHVFLVACPQAIETLVEIENPKPSDITVRKYALGKAGGG